MADNTKIEWADATVNAVNGCSVVSPGCTNCYAMRLAGTRMKHHPSRAGLTQESKAGPVWTGEVRLHEGALLQPLAWKRPRRIFWNAHGDTFHDAVPDDWIDRVFAVCALTPQHTHMILTKRSARMREYLTAFVRGERNVLGAARDLGRLDEASDALLAAAKNYPSCTSVGPLPNVWLGVSVEDQTRADERIPDLLATPAAKRFISAEPLLGPVYLTRIDCGCEHLDAFAGYSWLKGSETDLNDIGNDGIDWVIVGGESGLGARPMHPDWARSLRDQCADAGVPFHFKQWGEWLPWSPGCPPEWESQNGRRDDHHALLPDDIDADPRWDDGIWAVPEHEHFAFQRVGKKAAGRLLDGAEHNGVPA